MLGDFAKTFQGLGRLLVNAVQDLAPIVVVIAFFQVVVIRQPFPNLAEILIGAVLVVFGLAFFVRGLESGLFPLGESMAQAFSRKGNVYWIVAFAFSLGFGTTVAEPALIAVAKEAAQTVAEAGDIGSDPATLKNYAFGLRMTVAGSVGFAIVMGVIRIIKGWPIQWLIIVGYLGVVGLTFVAPPEIVGIAYDSGGVTTSTITVPLVTALGVGLASSIRGRNAMTDGFGLIAFASLTPMMFVMVYGIVN